MAVRPHPKKSNAWIIDYYPNGRKGKRIRKTIEDVEFEVAKDLERKLRQEHVLTGQEGETGRLKTIEEALPDYLAWCRIHRAKRTYDDIQSSLRVLLPVFGRLYPSKLMPAHVLAFKQRRLKEGAGNRTINKQLYYLQGIIRWMVENGLAKPLPFKIEKLPYQRPLPKAPSREQIRAFLREIRDEEKLAMIFFMLESGLRFSEMTHLRWQDINWDEGFVTIKGKGGRFRLAVLPPSARDYLENMRQESGYVFVNPKTGRPYTTLKTLFRLASRRANLSPAITPHMLRHAFATNLLADSRDLRLVQVALGHQSVTTTEIYTKITLTRLKDEIARASDHMDKNPR